MNDENVLNVHGEASSNTLRVFRAWGQVSAEPDGVPKLCLQLSWRSAQARRLGADEVAVELTLGKFKGLTVSINGDSLYSDLNGVNVAGLLTSPAVFAATVMAALKCLDPLLWCAVVAGFEEALHRVRAEWPPLVKRFMTASALVGRAL